MRTKKYINDLAYELVGCAIEVHKQIGPGLLENVYDVCFREELTYQGFQFTHQLKVPIVYRNAALEAQLRLDVLVENLIVVELKSVERSLPLFEAQVLSYMKLLQMPKGLLINFNSDNIAKNTKYFVNEFFSDLPDK